MAFYDLMSREDLGTQIKNTVVKQNDLLKLLQEEPCAKAYESGQY